VVLEVAVLDVKTGQNADFEAAFAQAAPLIASIPGYNIARITKMPRAATALFAPGTVGNTGSPHRGLSPVATVPGVETVAPSFL
jgi:hypothetical protein